MLDIHQIMADLAKRRPVFHSEADFQHALAWLIHETRPGCGCAFGVQPIARRRQSYGGGHLGSAVRGRSRH